MYNARLRITLNNSTFKTAAAFHLLVAEKKSELECATAARSGRRGGDDDDVGGQVGWRRREMEARRWPKLWPDEARSRIKLWQIFFVHK